MQRSPPGLRNKSAKTNKPDNRLTPRGKSSYVDKSLAPREPKAK